MSGAPSASLQLRREGRAGHCEGRSKYDLASSLEPFTDKLVDRNTATTTVQTVLPSASVPPREVRGRRRPLFQFVRYSKHPMAPTAGWPCEVSTLSTLHRIP
jgi:hypothetical protein